MSLATVKLSQILKLEYGKGLPEYDRDIDGTYAAYGANGVKSRTNKFLYDKPSIIVGRKGSAGELTLVKDKFWALDVTYYVTHDDKKTDLMYLYYALQTKNLTFYARGVKPGINRNDVYELEIPLPPLPIQQKIVAKLDAIFAEIDKATAAAETNAKNAEALFQSYLTEVFDKNESSKLYKLDDVVTRLTNGYVGATKNIYLDSGIPYLLARHVKNNILTFDNRTFISEDFNKKNKKSILKIDDVLLVQSGHIGHSAVVPDEHVGHNCHAMIVITTVKEILGGEFLSLYFQSNKMKNLFEDMRTGSTIKHLNCGDVKLLMVPIPLLDRQIEIINEGKKIQIRVELIKKNMLDKVVQLKNLRGSILNQAFNGELVKE